MASDAQPQRTCVGCRRRRPQAELVRCALGPDGRAVVSRTAPGRGAWLCDPPLDCLALAVRRRAFDRAWRARIGAETLAHLEGLLRSRAGTVASDGPPHR